MLLMVAERGASEGWAASVEGGERRRRKRGVGE